MAVAPDNPASGDLTERTYRALVEAAPDIVVVFDRAGRIRFINPAVTALLGYDPSEVRGQRIQDYIHPQDLGKALERVGAIQAESPSTAQASNYRLRARDGSYRDLETLAVNRVDDRDIDGIFVIARDVTGRVQAESSRLAAEERRRLAAEIARIGIWEWNLETDALEADEAVRQLARQQPGQVWTGPGEFLQRFAVEDRAPLAAAMRAASSGEATCRQVARMPLPDGGMRWLYIYARRPTGPAGLSPWLVGLIMDVTEQKRAEEEARRRGELLELASWGADLGSWTWFPLQDRAVIDARSIELMGLAGSHAERRTAECNATVHPDDLPELTRLESELVSGQRERFDFSYRVLRPDGRWRWLMDRSRVTQRDPDGRVTQVSGVTLDVDADKNRELELAEQRLRLDLALKASGLGLWDIDAESGDLYVDERYCEITGLPPGAARRHHSVFDALIHEDDRPPFVAATAECFAGRSGHIAFEGRLMTPDGRFKWVTVDGAVVRRGPDGRAARLVGTLSDITERRRIDQLTRAGELVASSGSYEYDTATGRFYWSRGTYRVFEYPEDLVPGEAAIVDLLLPGSRPKLQQALRALREEGRGFDIEIEGRTARGRRIWVRIMGQAESFAGRPVRFFGIVQDVTPRKRLESALVDATNREQQRLGRELHDGLGQELTGIALHLQGLSGQLKATDPALARPIDRLGTLLSGAIRSARMLAHGLAPVSRGQGGLEGALQRLAADAGSAHGIPVTATFDLRRPLRLDEVAGSHLYRICQEALSNAMRHGKPSSVAIRLRSTLDALMLEIVDDGCGIPPPGERGSGMGLQSMRYRAESLHGTLEVARRASGGTRAQVTIPLAG